MGERVKRGVHLGYVRGCGTLCYAVFRCVILSTNVTFSSSSSSSSSSSPSSSSSGGQAPSVVG